MQSLFVTNEKKLSVNYVIHVTLCRWQLVLARSHASKERDDGNIVGSNKITRLCRLPMRDSLAARLPLFSSHQVHT